jgi:hypothetical protein
MSVGGCFPTFRRVKKSKQNSSWTVWRFKIETLVGSHPSSYTVNYLVRKKPLLVRIQLQPALIIPSHFFKIHFNLILPSNLSFVTKAQDALYFFACYMPLPSHPPWFNHSNNISCTESVKLLIIHFTPCLGIVQRSKVHPSYVHVPRAFNERLCASSLLLIPRTND